MAVFEHIMRLLTADSEQNAQRLAARLDEVEQKALGADKSLKRVGDSAGEVGSNAGKLTGILDRMSPALGDAARLAADTADAFEVASFAGGKLSLSAGAVATAASAVAIGVAAVTAAVSIVANEMDKARDKTQRYRDALVDTETATVSLINSQNALKLAQGDVAGFVADLQIQTALLRGEVTQADVVAGQLGGKLADALRQDLLDAGKALAAVQVQIQTVQRGLDEDGFSVAASNKIAQLRVQEEQLQRNLDGIKEAQREGTAAINDYVQVLGELDNKESDTATSAERTTAVITDQGDAARRAASDLAALAAAFDALPRDQRLESLRASVSAFAPTAAPLDARTQAGLLSADVALAASQGRISASELQDMTAAIEAGLQAGLREESEALREAAAAQREAAAAQRDAAIQTVGAALTGDPTALLSLAGGGLQRLGSGLIGAGAGGAGLLTGLAGGSLSAIAGPAGLAIGALAAIGDMGAQGVKQQAMALKDAVIGGIEALPEIIVEVIPPFVKALVTELPIAVARAFGELVERWLALIFPRLFGGGGRDRDGGSTGIGENSAIQSRDDALELSSGGKTSQTVDPLTSSRARSARSLRLDASRRGLLAAARRGGGMHAGIVAPTFNALSADSRFMVDATERIARLTDPATGLRRGGA